MYWPITRFDVRQPLGFFSHIHSARSNVNDQAGADTGILKGAKGSSGIFFLKGGSNHLLVLEINKVLSKKWGGGRADRLDPAPECLNSKPTLRNHVVEG